MPKQNEMRSWSRQPLTKWFLDQLQNRYGNINNEWRAVTTTDGLANLKGKVEVIDFINLLITDPEAFDISNPIVVIDEAS